MNHSEHTNVTLRQLDQTDQALAELEQRLKSNVTVLSGWVHLLQERLPTLPEPEIYRFLERIDQCMHDLTDELDYCIQVRRPKNKRKLPEGFVVV